MSKELRYSKKASIYGEIRVLRLSEKSHSDYYQNLDTIVVMRLQESITELHQAETVARKKCLRQQVEKALDKLKIELTIKSLNLETQFEFNYLNIQRRGFTVFFLKV